MANFVKYAGRRVMSGIQPTAGSPHIGNYFGALANWKALAAAATRRTDVIFSIVDLHALTTALSAPGQMPNLAQASRDMACAVLGCGVDPEKCVLYRQSHVQQHTELSWILNCLATPGQMDRMTQFKDKIQHNPKAINMGLYSYVPSACPPASSVVLSCDYLKETCVCASHVCMERWIGIKPGVVHANASRPALWMLDCRRHARG